MLTKQNEKEAVEKFMQTINYERIISSVFCSQHCHVCTCVHGYSRVGGPAREFVCERECMWVHIGLYVTKSCFGSYSVYVYVCAFACVSVLVCVCVSICVYV